MKAFSGSLVSLDLLEPLSRGDAAGAPALRGVLAAAALRLGPASGARQIFDLLASPIVAQAGGAIAIVESTADAISAHVAAPAAQGVGSALFQPIATLAASGWNADLRRLRQATVRRAAAPRW